MQKALILLAGVGWLSMASLRAADQPKGSVLELHSCELYAGGCVVSSEEPLDGRQMLRVWNFTGGSFDNVDLSGLRLAVLQSSAENLAAAGTKSGEAVAYLPANASDGQRAALVAWLKASQPDLTAARLHTRITDLRMSAQERKGYTFSAGEFITVSAASLESCETGACGESLWYNPRAVTTFFTVVADRGSRISEPLLKLTWNDAGKRSIFLGKFGEGSAAKNMYVTASDLCAPGKLF
jgi:hypothetical protein